MFIQICPNSNSRNHTIILFGWGKNEEKENWRENEKIRHFSIVWLYKENREEKKDGVTHLNSFSSEGKKKYVGWRKNY